VRYRRAVEKIRILAEACRDSPQEVIWETTPRGTQWLADYLRLSKGGFAYFWRSHLDPVSNHHIRGPVRFWSLAGPDEDVLLALSERRLGDLPQVTSPPGTEGAQRAGELQAALDHLRGVRDSYWDYGWRRENRGGGRYYGEQGEQAVGSRPGLSGSSRRQRIAS